MLLQVKSYSGSGGACTGSTFGAYASDCTGDAIASGIVYGRGILDDGRSTSGADGSGLVGGQG